MFKVGLSSFPSVVKQQGVFKQGSQTSEVYMMDVHTMSPFTQKQINFTKPTRVKNISSPDANVDST